MGVDHPGSLAQETQRKSRDQKRNGKATLQNSAIGRAIMRFYAGGRIRIEDGGGIDILDSGYLNIDGDLSGDGVLDWTGTVYFKGPTGVQGNFAVSGPTVFTGTFKVTGDTDLDGDISLTGDMAVRAGGRIRVQGGGGDVVLDSTYGVPRVSLGAAQIEAGSASFTFTVGTQVVYFFDNTIRIPAMASRPVSDFPGGFAGAVVADGTGKFYRLV